MSRERESQEIDYPSQVSHDRPEYLLCDIAPAINHLPEASAHERRYRHRVAAALEVPEVLLVLDGSTGQNAFIQATEFTKATEVSALAITKLDGTAKGGVVIGISDQFRIPVKYIGVGEKIDDLQTFNKMEFVDSFFKK